MDYVAIQTLVKEIHELLGLVLPPEVFPEINYTQEKNPAFTLNDDVVKEKPIEDLLGVYSSDPSEQRLEIKIFVRECEACARLLGVPEQIVINVVLCHEAAHFVTHKGAHEIASWRNFSQVDTALKEKLAQIITLLVLHKTGDKEGETLFRELAKHQSDPYNEWKEWDFKGTGRSFEESCEIVRKEVHDQIDAAFLQDVCDETSSKKKRCFPPLTSDDL